MRRRCRTIVAAACSACCECQLLCWQQGRSWIRGCGACGLQSGEEASAVKKVAERARTRWEGATLLNISLLREFLPTVSPSCSCSHLPSCLLRCTPSSSRRNRAQPHLRVTPLNASQHPVENHSPSLSPDGPTESTSVPQSPSFTMLGYLTSRWQASGDSKKTSPGWYDRNVSPILLAVSKKACTHPIHTIVTIAFVASYSYLGVLDKGLLERDSDAVTGRVDFQTLLAGSKNLRIGEETSWQWEAAPGRGSAPKDQQEFALVTLVFPETSTLNSAPPQNALPANVSAKLLPSSSSSFSTLSHDTSLAFSVPYTEAADFLLAMQEMPAPADAADSQGSDKEGTREDKKWMMRASKNGNTPGGIRNWVLESWTSFVDLLKVSSFSCPVLPPRQRMRYYHTVIPV